ncbi:MAG: tRNA lysidine(34) synthetase TilS, partial [Armatimonadetes bacterium]|nr:tRNA lysidine(34) synthetase TilS [Armatimonadota bacterium]
MRDTDLLDTVEPFVRRHHLLRAGADVVVAVSGGADSVALLACLRDLVPRWSLRLRVAHLNHGLRPEAGDDARFVTALADAWGLPLDVETADVRQFARAHHLSVEAAAREVRYAFLRRTAERHGARTVAVGHTADDQAETLLLRLTRGGRPAGMWPRRPLGQGAVIRPLLDLWRRELRGYLVRRGLPWRDDPSNQDLRHLRNRIRHDLIPALAGYIPDVQKRLKQAADALAADDAALEALAERAEAAVIAPMRGGVALHPDRLLEHPEAVRRRLIRRAVAQAGGNIRRLRFVHIEEALRLAAAGRHGQRLSLPGVALEVRGEGLLLVASG